MALRTIAQSWLAKWSPWRLRAQVEGLYADVDRHAADASRWRLALIGEEKRHRDSGRTPLEEAALQINAMYLAGLNTRERERYDAMVAENEALRAATIDAGECE